MITRLPCIEFISHNSYITTQLTFYISITIFRGANFYVDDFFKMFVSFYLSRKLFFRKILTPCWKVFCLTCANRWLDMVFIIRFWYNADQCFPNNLYSDDFVYQTLSLLCDMLKKTTLLLLVLFLISTYPPCRWTWSWELDESAGVWCDIVKSTI